MKRFRFGSTLSFVTTRRVWLGIAAGFPLLCADGEEAARKAGETWLSLLDQGKYRDAWNQASEHGRVEVTAEEWEGQIRAMREAAGQMQNRKFSIARATRTMAGAPDGEYMVLEYSTAFAKKAKAVETLMMSREGGNWKAAGYHIL